MQFCAHSYIIQCPVLLPNIQACLEGKISDLPELKERDSFGKQLNRFFIFYPRLYTISLVGAQVVDIFTWPDAPEVISDLI